MSATLQAQSPTHVASQAPGALSLDTDVTTLSATERSQLQFDPGIFSNEDTTITDPHIDHDPPYNMSQSKKGWNSNSASSVRKEAPLEAAFSTAA